MCCPRNLQSTQADWINSAFMSLPAGQGKPGSYVFDAIPVTAVTGVTGKMGARFPVTAVTPVTEAPVRPCEAVCAAFSGWAEEVPATGEIGHVRRLWATPPKTTNLGETVRGSGTGERPPFRWGQHRVCLDMGEAPALPNTFLRAEARTHFQDGGEHEKRHHIQHSDSL